jgi:hypothetical protein
MSDSAETAFELVKCAAAVNIKSIKKFCKVVLPYQSEASENNICWQLIREPWPVASICSCSNNDPISSRPDQL